MLYQDGTRLFSLSRFHINCLDYIVLFCVILEYFCIIKFLVTHPAPLVIVSRNRILIMEIVSSRESTLPATAHGWHIPSLLFIEIMQELLLKCPLSLFNLSVPFAVMMCHSHHPSTQTNYSWWHSPVTLSVSQIFSWWHFLVAWPLAKFFHGLHDLTVTSPGSSGLTDVQCAVALIISSESTGTLYQDCTPCIQGIKLKSYACLHWPLT